MSARRTGAARNTGFAHSTGAWIAILDADDVWHREKTEVQLRAAEANPAVALLGSGIELTRLPERLAPAPRVRPLGVHDFLTDMPVAPSGAMVGR